MTTSSRNFITLCFYITQHAKPTEYKNLIKITNCDLTELLLSHIGYRKPRESFISHNRIQKTSIRHSMQQQKTNLMGQILYEQSEIFLRIPIRHITRLLHLFIVIRVHTLIIRLVCTKTRTKGPHNAISSPYITTNSNSNPSFRQ